MSKIVIIVFVVLSVAVIFGAIRYMAAPTLMTQEELDKNFPTTGGKQYKIGK